MNAIDVLEQALGLSEVERLNLAERLLDSVDRESSADEEFEAEVEVAKLAGTLGEARVGCGQID